MSAAAPKTKKPRPKRFSMLRTFTAADFITLGNGFAGTASVLCVMKYLITQNLHFLYLTFGLLPAAMVFDFADGRVARWRQKASLLGQELDSLADLVSFGVAPAALAFGVGMQGAFDAIVLMYFVACGLSRLARYNVTASSLADDSGKVRYYEGTPIPTSLLLVALIGVLVGKGMIGDALPLGAIRIGHWIFHPLVLLFAASGSAMISKTLHIPKP